jgi:multiple sugar transport system permease protein
MSSVSVGQAASAVRRRDPAPRRGPRGIRGQEGLWGWLFVSPALLLLTIFVALPILLAAYVSLLDWNGTSSPFTGGAEFAGLDNYRELIFQDRLARKDFATALRNNFYYVVGVVPLQTALALFLAVIVNQRWLKGRGFFRTAFFFPSITSSVAISLVFIYLFQAGGAINGVLRLFGVGGPAWFADRRGLLHIMLGGVGVDAPPGWARQELMGLPVWDWLAGPSVALCAIMLLVAWTTAGTFMIMFLASLQNISNEVEEASIMDGAGPWERFRYVTLPLLKPTLFLVLTLGLISTWQVFDQIYVMSSGDPAKTTLTPAFLSYQQAFIDSRMGLGAAIAFCLFVIIIVFVLLQRWLLRGGGEAR